MPGVCERVHTLTRHSRVSVQGKQSVTVAKDLTSQEDFYPSHHPLLFRLQVGNSWRMKVWEKPHFEGQSMEVADNMPVFHERWHSRDVHSCKVFEGAWVFYEHPNYRGRQYLLERGEYRRYSEWGAMQPNVGSIRRVSAN